MAQTISGAIGRALLVWIISYAAITLFFTYFNVNATDGSYPLDDTQNSSSNVSTTTPLGVAETDGRGSDSSSEAGLDDLPAWVMDLNEEELALLLAEEPLEELELVAVNTDPFPEAVEPLSNERRQELRQFIQERDSSMEIHKQELEWMKEQLGPLEEALRHVEQTRQELQQRTDSAEDNIWQVVESKIHQWGEEYRQKQVGKGTNSLAADRFQQSLSRVSTLSRYQTNDDVHHHFQRLLDSLQYQIENADTVSWKELTESLRPNNNRYPAMTSSPVACPERLEGCELDPNELVEEDENETETAIVDDQTILTEEYLMEKIDGLRNMMLQAHDPSKCPVVLPEWQQSWSDFQVALTEEWYNRATGQIRDSWDRQVRDHEERQHEDPRVDDESNDSDCVERQQVESIVQAGLFALERNEDLNHALLESLAQQGVDTNRIILDAVIEEDHTMETRWWENRDHLAEAGGAVYDKEFQFTWRQIFDRPLTKTVAHSWLPWMIDAIGGYNEALDEWLDQWLDEGTSSVFTNDDDITDPTGVFLHKYILDLAGKYALPPTVLESWLAGQWRKRKQSIYAIME